LIRRRATFASSDLSSSGKGLSNSETLRNVPRVTSQRRLEGLLIASGPMKLCHQNVGFQVNRVHADGRFVVLKRYLVAPTRLFCTPEAHFGFGSRL
jgi:hypothetical protein